MASIYVIYNPSDMKFGSCTGTMFHSLLVFHKVNALASSNETRSLYPLNQGKHT
jgi:hypothetical protein